MGILRFENVTKKFEDNIALDLLSFDVPENKIVGLIGANGAGKSTSMRHAIRYLKPDSGSILYRDDDIYSLSNKSFPISYIPDNPIFYEELTVREHLEFIGAMYKTNCKIDTLVEQFEMKKHIDKVPSQLSKGTKQKLMIMCGLLRQYELLIADEPFTGLDPRQIRVLKDVFLEQRKLGKTVLLSTHLLNMIENICDYYIMIDNGQLLAQGSLEDLINKGKFETLEDIYLHFSDDENDADDQQE